MFLGSAPVLFQPTLPVLLVQIGSSLIELTAAPKAPRQWHLKLQNVTFEHGCKIEYGDFKDIDVVVTMATFAFFVVLGFCRGMSPT